MSGKRTDSIVNIDGVLYPIYEVDGKFMMKYAGIDLHPTDTVKELLAVFEGHDIKHYKTTVEFKGWYNGIIDCFVE